MLFVVFFQEVKICSFKYMGDEIMQSSVIG